jgi:hypothetical protein
MMEHHMTSKSEREATGSVFFRAMGLLSEEERRVDRRLAFLDRGRARKNNPRSERSGLVYWSGPDWSGPDWSGPDWSGPDLLCGEG